MGHEVTPFSEKAYPPWGQEQAPFSAPQQGQTRPSSPLPHRSTMDRMSAWSGGTLQGLGRARSGHLLVHLSAYWHTEAEVGVAHQVGTLTLPKQTV